MNTQTFPVPTRHGPLAFSSTGHGPPLVLLPANGHDARDFDAIRGVLSRSFRVLAFDWPGMGASAPFEHPERSRAGRFAEMIEDAADALDLAPCIFVGHSVGGFAATRLAARRPARVRALVLVDTGGFAPVGRGGALFCRVKGTAFATRFGEGVFARWHTKQRNTHVTAMLGRIDRARRNPAYAATVAGVWRSFAGPEHDLRQDAASIRCPTLLVWGGLDPVLPARIAGKAAEQAIPGARLVLLAAGHSPFVEAPDAFLAELEPFLATLPSEGVVSQRSPAGCRPDEPGWMESAG